MAGKQDNQARINRSHGQVVLVCIHNAGSPEKTQTRLKAGKKA